MTPPATPLRDERRAGPTVLLAGRGDGWAALQECLRAAGWDSVRAEGPEECRATIQALGCGMVVVFSARDEDGSLWAGLGAHGAAHAVVLAMDAPASRIERALERSGAIDYLELPLRPELALRRLRTIASLQERSGGESGSLAAEAALEPRGARAQLTRLEDRAPLVELLRSDLGGEEHSGSQAALLVVRAARVNVGDGDAEHGSWLARLEALGELLSGLLAGPDGSLPPRSRISRLDVERFAIAVVGLRDAADVERQANELFETLHGHWVNDPRTQACTISLGYAFEPVRQADPARLLDHAETACYCARQQGRRKAQPYSDYMSLWASERRELIEGLRSAVENDELVVHYQPRVEARTRRVLGMEALVRWHHAELGLVPPAKFIPLAEESGLISPVGEWVLREACRQNREWQRRGLAPVRVSVNLSAVQFHQPQLFETVTGTLADTELEPRWLELELTESMLMNDPRSTIATLRRFKDAGIHLSIDDFGTGYSSLSYLKRFPIDALKIDRSFVREITTNPDDAAIATAIILMGHSLKLDVVAEGVETESQLSFLQILQCNEVQGYLISPPVPAEKAESFLATPRVVRAV